MTRQLPEQDEVFLDHVAHFVPDLDAAAALLARVGFRLTPFTAQQNRTPQGIVPAGMANRCIMLREGYLEFLTAVGDTELARQFHAATARYVGLHLIAFALADPAGAHARLEAGGFRPKAPVNLTRPVTDADGAPGEARFTVLRVPPEVMPEGRVQALQHHTPELVWQPRSLEQDNAVVSLKAVLLSVPDPQEAAQRFGRFVGRTPRRADRRWLLPLERGACVFVAPEDLPAVLPWAGPPPAAPAILATGLGSADPARTAACFAAGGLEPRTLAPGQSLYRFPPEIGGAATVVAQDAQVCWAT